VGSKEFRGLPKFVAHLSHTKTSFEVFRRYAKFIKTSIIVCYIKALNMSITEHYGTYKNRFLYDRTAEVRGSIPLGSTNKIKGLDGLTSKLKTGQQTPSKHRRRGLQIILPRGK
jgi:hypothetical protein